MFGLERKRLSGILAVAVFLFAPAFAAAQAMSSAAEAQHAHADRVHDAAVAHATAGADGIEDLVLRLAEFHRVSADLRLASDPRAVECNAIQANYLYLAGHPAQAMKYMMLAGGIALINGDVFGAMTAYLDAGAVAAEQGWTEQVERLAADIQFLADRPGLSPEERAVVERRLAGI